MESTFRPEFPVDKGMILIEDDQLVIQDQQAREVTFAVADAPEVVSGIIGAILEQNAFADGEPNAEQAMAHDILIDAATALNLVMDKR